jgi:hypothetical protein
MPYKRRSVAALAALHVASEVWSRTPPDTRSGPVAGAAPESGRSVCTSDRQSAAPADWEQRRDAPREQGRGGQGGAARDHGAVRPGDHARPEQAVLPYGGTKHQGGQDDGNGRAARPREAARQRPSGGEERGGGDEQRENGGGEFGKHSGTIDAGEAGWL